MQGRIDSAGASTRISGYLRSNVLGLVAIFIALGGTSYAVTHLPRNSVGRRQIKNNAVIGKKVKNASLTGADLANDSVTGQQVAESSLGTVPSATSADSATSASQLGGSIANGACGHATALGVTGARVGDEVIANQLGTSVTLNPEYVVTNDQVDGV